MFVFVFRNSQSELKNDGLVNEPSSEKRRCDRQRTGNRGELRFSEIEKGDFARRLQDWATERCGPFRTWCGAFIGATTGKK